MSPEQFSDAVMTSSEDDPARGASDPPEGESAPDSPGTAGTPAGPSDPPAGPLREALRPAGPPRLGLRVDQQPDSVVAYLEGELDILTTPKFGARINGVIRESTGDLVLDLRGVEFIDSAGLQLLLNTRRRLLRRQRNLSVICEEGPVKRLIALMRLTDILGVINS